MGGLNDRPTRAPPTYLLLLLVGLALVRGFVYATIVPPWQSPDEYRHYEYVRLTQEKGRLVGYDDVSAELEERIIASLVRNEFWRYGYAPQPYDPARPPQRLTDVHRADIAHSLYQPPLYYALVAVLTRPFGATSIEDELLFMRLCSVLFSALTVLAAGLVARELFPGEPFLALAVPIFVTFLPMFTFIGASVNPEVLTALFGALALLAMARLLRRGLSLSRVVALGLSLGLALLTKRTALALIPGALAALMLSQQVRLSELVSGRRVLALLVPLVVVAGYLADQVLRLEAKVTELAIIRAVLERWQLRELLDLQELFRGLLVVAFKTFWGTFGWANVWLDETFYWLALVGSGVSLIGLGWQFLRPQRGLSAVQQQGVLLCGLSVLAVFGATLVAFVWQTSGGGVYAAQGRYYFLVLVPIAVLFAVGLHGLTRRGWHRRLLLLYAGGFVLWDTASFWVYLFPSYYR